MPRPNFTQPRFTSWLWALMSLAVGCAPRQTPYVEGLWGNAPAPYASEVTEITFEHRHCARGESGCTMERATLRRDGYASRAVQLRKGVDSTLVGTIDSLDFVTLAEELRQAGFFSHTAGTAVHEPLSTESYLISAASLCRRASQSYTVPEHGSRPMPEYIGAIEGRLQKVHWERCCHALR